MFKASRRAPADRDTLLTRAVVDVGVVWSHRVPKPQGADLPTGAPTNAAFFDAWPVHGLAFATPAATARRAQVLIMFWFCVGGWEQGVSRQADPGWPSGGAGENSPRPYGVWVYKEGRRLLCPERFMKSEMANPTTAVVAYDLSAFYRPKRGSIYGTARRLRARNSLTEILHPPAGCEWYTWTRHRIYARPRHDVCRLLAQVVAYFFRSRERNARRLPVDRN